MSSERDGLLRSRAREEEQGDGNLPDSKFSNALGSPDTSISTSEPDNIYQNFLIMSIFFSLNHGCVVSCLAYSTTELGNTMGGAGSGVLYVCYALTAFFLSKPVVSMIGPKRGLIIGVVGYCVYVLAFLLAVVIPSSSDDDSSGTSILVWTIFMISCAVGGIAGGLLWTSQGRYFARNARVYYDSCALHYARDSDEFTIEKINASFAGIFASCYLGFEMVTKLLATIIWLFDSSSAPYIVFSVYSILAIVAAVFIANISDLEENGTWDFSWSTVSTNTLAAAQLVWDDARLALMIPFQMSFGFASSFVPYYVLGTIIADSSELGSAYVGLLSSVIVMTGAIIAMPAAWAANKLGKAIVMSMGGLCLAAAGGFLFIFSDAQLGTWSLIILYLVVYGIGRGTWENTNKAVIADLFSSLPEMSTSAFAAISFSNGLAGAIGYFVYDSMTRLEMASLVFGTSLFAVVCYLGCVLIDANYRREIEDRLVVATKYNI